MGFDFHFHFQKNGVKPRVIGKTGSYTQVQKQSCKEHNFSNSIKKTPTMKKEACPKKVPVEDAFWGLMSTNQHTAPRLAQRMLSVHPCCGAREKQPDPLKDLWSLAVTWAALGYFCWWLLVLKGTVFWEHIIWTQDANWWQDRYDKPIIKSST